MTNQYKRNLSSEADVTINSPRKRAVDNEFLTWLSYSL